MFHENSWFEFINKQYVNIIIELTSISIKAKYSFPTGFLRKIKPFLILFKFNMHFKSIASIDNINNKSSVGNCMPNIILIIISIITATQYIIYTIVLDTKLLIITFFFSFTTPIKNIFCNNHVDAINKNISLLIYCFSIVYIIAIMILPITILIYSYFLLYILKKQINTKKFIANIFIITFTISFSTIN